MEHHNSYSSEMCLLGNVTHSPHTPHVKSEARHIIGTPVTCDVTDLTSHVTPHSRLVVPCVACHLISRAVQVCTDCLRCGALPTGPKCRADVNGYKVYQMGTWAGQWYGYWNRRAVDAER